jgi:flavin reductase (DIM6/NTAB) family NADH-FMN oxidoreductase RutF
MQMTQTFSTRDLRNAFGSFATGITIVTANRPDGSPIGITANSFSSVSLDPPLIMWCIASESKSIDAFLVGSHFAVTILNEADKDIVMHFAGKVAEKFPIKAETGPHGPSPLVPCDHLCRFDCIVESTHIAGDHLIIVGQVHAFDHKEGAPILFHGGKFGKFKQESKPTPFDIWDSTGVELPWIFNSPFD